MKISELINTLVYELSRVGDIDVEIAIQKKHKETGVQCSPIVGEVLTTQDIITTLDVSNDKSLFIIQSNEILSEPKVE